MPADTFPTETDGKLKQKRVPRPSEIDSMPAGKSIARNADPIWLHQNEL
jgi:hypothetical protein